MWRSNRLEWTAGGTHPFTFEIRQPRWPPFFATAFFLPRIKLKIKNAGELLSNRTTIALYVDAYDGPIGAMPSQQIQWNDTEYKYLEGGWKPGESKRVRLSVRSRNLPHEGAYVLRLLVTESVPLGTPWEEALEMLRELSNTT